MITKEFKKEYGKLNKEQKMAVDTIEGPVMVVAGPGTGKTTILTLRIANILLKTDMQPEKSASACPVSPFRMPWYISALDMGV